MRKDKPLETLNYAFEVADKSLDIPKMLDAEGSLHLCFPKVALSDIFFPLYFVYDSYLVIQVDLVS